MFITVKGKNILATILTILIISIIVLILFKVVQTNKSPLVNKTIVIDAGHGGIDGGSVGVSTNNDENHLNLEYAFCLKEYFENFGYNVILTRKTLDGLYSITAKNKKKDDMQKRKEIIDNSLADIVISIHMNSFPAKSCKGAQVFYNKDNSAGKQLATSIQQKFVNDLPNAKKLAKSGDYFMVNCTTLPSVIVECGYLSNPEEDKLLSTLDYKNKVCYSIFCGVVTYFGNSSV